MSDCSLFLSEALSSSSITINGIWERRRKLLWLLIVFILVSLSCLQVMIDLLWISEQEGGRVWWY